MLLSYSHYECPELNEAKGDDQFQMRWLEDQRGLMNDGRAKSTPERDNLSKRWCN